MVHVLYKQMMQDHTFSEAGGQTVSRKQAVKTTLTQSVSVFLYSSFFRNQQGNKCHCSEKSDDVFCLGMPSVKESRQTPSWLSGNAAVVTGVRAGGALV